MTRRLVVMVRAGALRLAITGCTLTAAAPATHQTNAVVTPKASPTPSATPTSSPIPPPAAPKFGGLGFWAKDYFSEAQQPVDCGAIEYAAGTVKLDAKGMPVSYAVAPGDIFEIIAKRFDIGTAHLVAINAVRRDSPMIVYVGDTINLDPATITTIGDQNGVVYAHQDRLPDQHVPPH